MILAYKGKKPNIEGNVFIAPTAVVIGDVTIGAGASIWYGAVIRGDMEPIVIGEDTNIQDNCTVHTDEGYPTAIGARVTVGHNAVVHGCTLGDNCLIGIGALVLSGSVVEKEAVVAAGAVVREGQRIGPRELVAGIPAKLKRVLTAEEAKAFNKPMANYRALWPSHAHETKLQN
ncbi:MAG: gamma carbonic anhydrase family protein [Desulfobacterales bacterium]|nr:gamma carbonic anhydrase family protein [Desulfobacterales bacterium]